MVRATSPLGPPKTCDNMDIGSHAEVTLRSASPIIDGSEGVDRTRHEQAQCKSAQAVEGKSFTWRGVLVGLAVGLLICFSNMYFGLQTGWISGMAMPSALIGYAFFKTLSKHLDLPFTPVENVLVQTVAGSMGTMPLGCGFVGVMPAMNYLMTTKENGPITLSMLQSILWALGLCFFGVLFAVPLRRQVIIREQLRFPSGTATALMIGVLHDKVPSSQESTTQHRDTNDDNGQRVERLSIDNNETRSQNNWREKMKLLTIAFTSSALYTLTVYFVPAARKLPIFGRGVARKWLWNLNPSLGYVGQGIIMGPSVTTHMLVGALIGWAILSPLAKHRGWAPGPVADWESGSRGWIVWVSLAIMLSDALVNLAHLAIVPILRQGPKTISKAFHAMQRRGCNAFAETFSSGDARYSLVYHADNDEYDDANADNQTGNQQRSNVHEEPDAPPDQLVNVSTFAIGLLLSVALCVVNVHLIFGSLVPIYASMLAVIVALLLSVMGVRAMGETDLNPVSGISKLAQLFFALVVSKSNKNYILINLIAGAISEAGALQAGDLLQDLKTGHLLGAAPNAQFWGQILGSAAGAVVSALIYKLYVNVYEVPGEQFPVPTGYVWIFTARLVTGKGLPEMATEWAIMAAALFTCITVVRIYLRDSPWVAYIPGGIAVAVGKFIAA